MPPASGPAPPAPLAAAGVFGAGLHLATVYAELLAGPGVVRGLIGPRETARLWNRHLLNCAVLEELLPPGVRVVDVGSGAGLPGLALACARPDLRIDLVDSLRRRTDFLSQAVVSLNLADRVRVVTGRAEDREVRQLVGTADWVTARAVSSLGQLARICLPLLISGGSLLAMKGARAEAEMAEDRAAVAQAGGVLAGLELCGVGRVDEPARVVVVRKR